MSMSPDLTDPRIRRRAYIRIAQKRVRPGTGSSLEMLRSRTWRLPVFPLKSIVQTPFVVVGGVATRLYSVERATPDLDVLIATDTAESFYEELRQASSEQQTIISTNRWSLTDGTPLDVIESDEPWAHEALAVPAFAPDGMPVIRLPYLILMKLRSGRGIDIGDLSRMLGGAAQDTLEQVRAVVEKYQPDAVEDMESLIQLGRLEYEQGRRSG